MNRRKVLDTFYALDFLLIIAAFVGAGALGWYAQDLKAVSYMMSPYAVSFGLLFFFRKKRNAMLVYPVFAACVFPLLLFLITAIGAIAARQVSVHEAWGNLLVMLAWLGFGGLLPIGCFLAGLSGAFVVWLVTSLRTP